MSLSGTVEMITSSTIRRKWMTISMNSMKCRWEECKLDFIQLWKGGM